MRVNFNVKHKSWDCRLKNNRGWTVFNFITNKCFKIVSPSSSTNWSTHANRHANFLDFFLFNLSNHIHINISNLLNDFASDHILVTLKIQDNIDIIHSSKTENTGIYFEILCLVFLF